MMESKGMGVLQATPQLSRAPPSSSTSRRKPTRIRIDVGFITAHPELADKRIITSAVFQALIGATVVQTGAVTWAMARFLFPNQPD